MCPLEMCIENGQREASSDNVIVGNGRGRADRTCGTGQRGTRDYQEPHLFTR